MLNEDRTSPEWRKPLEELLLESDRKKITERLEVVESIIAERLQQLSERSEAEAERKAIEKALADLRGLKRDKLGFPDWE